MKPHGLVEWLRLITRLQKWIDQCPPDLSKPDHYYEVENVAHKDLSDLAKHFKVARKPENYTHRQSVEVELGHKASVTFYSPKRSFTYDDIYISNQ